MFVGQKVVSTWASDASSGIRTCIRGRDPGITLYVAPSVVEELFTDEAKNSRSKPSGAGSNVQMKPEVEHIRDAGCHVATASAALCQPSKCRDPVIWRKKQAIH